MSGVPSRHVHSFGTDRQLHGVRSGPLHLNHRHRPVSRLRRGYVVGGFGHVFCFISTNRGRATFANSHRHIHRALDPTTMTTTPTSVHTLSSPTHPPPPLLPQAPTRQRKDSSPARAATTPRTARSTRASRGPHGAPNAKRGSTGTRESRFLISPRTTLNSRRRAWAAQRG